MIDRTSIPRCTIGIPAYNEEMTLPTLLDSLERQVLPRDCDVHVVVVANGCTDRTVPVALGFAQRYVNELDFNDNGIEQWWHFKGGPFDYSVCAVAKASRNYALNIVHRSFPADAVMLFDADVRIGPGVVLLVVVLLVIASAVIYVARYLRDET